MAELTPMANKPKEWPKQPNPKEKGAVKGWDWKKKEIIPEARLLLALEALKDLFGNDPSLSGVPMRKLSAEHRKALDAFISTFPAPQKPELQIKQQKDCWRAIQMASQEIYLLQNKVNTKEIAYQHRWRMARFSNDKAKLTKIGQYLEAPKVKGRGYPRDKYLSDLLGLKKKKEDVRTEKTPTLKEVINSLNKRDFSTIMSLSIGTLVDMVRSTDAPKEDVKELRAVLEKTQQWFEKEFKLILNLIRMASE